MEDPWRLLQKTSDRGLSEPHCQPWGRMYGPFKNSQIADWSFFFGSIIFGILLYLTGGPSFFSAVGLRSSLIFPLIGTFVFYGLGEFWRSKRGRKYHQSQIRYLVLAILIVGMLLFVVGMSFLYNPTQTPFNVLFFVENGLIAGAIGLMIAYVFVRLIQKQAVTI